jgi:hypothetical protein
MRCEGMPERMGGHPFDQSGVCRSLLDRPLKRLFVHVVTVNHPGAWGCRFMVRREDPKPTPLQGRLRILAFQRIGQEVVARANWTAAVSGTGMTYWLYAWLSIRPWIDPPMKPILWASCETGAATTASSAREWQLGRAGNRGKASNSCRCCH